MKLKPPYFHILKLTLLISSSMLFLVLCYEMSRDLSITDEVIPLVELTPAIKITSTQQPIPDISEYSEISERPLFFPSRRKYIPPPVVEEEQIVIPQLIQKAPQPAGLFLSGVITTESQKLALIGFLESDRLEPLMVGESLENWTVSEIRPTLVILKNGNEEIVLELLRKSAGNG